MKNRPLDLEAVLAAWPTAQATTRFADRVLAACAPPAVKRRPRAGSLLAAAALVAASVMVPLFLSRAARPSDAAMASIPASFDLGPRQD
jgi:hypothetical protein